MKKLLILYFIIFIAKGYSQCTASVSANYTTPTCSTCCNGVITASMVGTICGPISCPTLQPLGITSCTGVWNNLCPGNYTVVIQDGGCCGNLICSVLLTSGTTAVKDFLVETDIKICPNPVSNFLHFNSEQYFEIETQIEIVNYLGKPVLKTDFRNEIDVSSLPDGVYTLLINSKGKITLKRLIIAK